MAEETDLQEVLRQNLRVLLALQRMSHAELAKELGTDRASVTKAMNGHRRWALQDLVPLSAIFGVAPQELIGDPATLVGAAHPVTTDTRISARVSGRCPSTNPRDLVTFTQVKRPRRGYHSRIPAIKRGVRPADRRPGHSNAAPVA